MIHRGDCDCYNYNIKLRDEEIARQIAANHAEWYGYDEDHIDWSVIDR
ncbi:hypothetical protein [Halalkalicoccus jeotgali]|nr:hypothetical protein [Halalkalicoccus jeotgali]